MTTPGILFTRSSHFPHKLGKAPAQAGAFRLPASPWEREKPDLFKIHFHKNYTNAQGARERALFCWSWRSAGPEGEGGCFDSPSLPPLDSLPTRNDQGGALDPKEEGRSKMDESIRNLDGRTTKWTPAYEDYTEVTTNHDYEVSTSIVTATGSYMGVDVSVKFVSVAVERIDTVD